MAEAKHIVDLPSRGRFARVCWAIAVQHRSSRLAVIPSPRRVAIGGDLDRRPQTARASTCVSQHGGARQNG
jgi:hypothetical protein